MRLQTVTWCPHLVVLLLSFVLIEYSQEIVLELVLGVVRRRWDVSLLMVIDVACCCESVSCCFTVIFYRFIIVSSAQDVVSFQSSRISNLTVNGSEIFCDIVEGLIILLSPTSTCGLIDVFDKYRFLHSFAQCLQFDVYMYVVLPLLDCNL